MLQIHAFRGADGAHPNSKMLLETTHPVPALGVGGGAPVFLLGVATGWWRSGAPMPVALGGGGNGVSTSAEAVATCGGALGAVVGAERVAAGVRTGGGWWAGRSARCVGWSSGGRRRRLVAVSGAGGGVTGGGGAVLTGGRIDRFDPERDFSLWI